ncbi:MAG: hypothetical protein AAB223_06085 [Pseudomonadota bacterium]
MSEILFEMRYVGRVVRITAIDPATGIEVISVGDAERSVEALKRLAARKLMYVLKRRRAKKLAERKEGGETA